MCKLESCSTGVALVKDFWRYGGAIGIDWPGGTEWNRVEPSGTEWNYAWQNPFSGKHFGKLQDILTQRRTLLAATASVNTLFLLPAVSLHLIQLVRLTSNNLLDIL